MLHEPAAMPQQEDRAAAYKARLGALMFAIYAAVYAGFVIINVVSPVTMETKVIFGLNLAVVYGFGLIVLALILALIYNRWCLAKEREMNRDVIGEGN